MIDNQLHKKYKHDLDLLKFIFECHFNSSGKYTNIVNKLFYVRNNIFYFEDSVDFFEQIIIDATSLPPFQEIMNHLTKYYRDHSYEESYIIEKICKYIENRINSTYSNLSG